LPVGHGAGDLERPDHQHADSIGVRQCGTEWAVVRPSSGARHASTGSDLGSGPESS